MEKKLTGYPSIDKPWLKYYSEEAINAPLPECTIYEYLWENNKDHLDSIAIRYYGRLIRYKELFRMIERTARSLYEFGVRKGDIVTVCLPTVPEAVYLIYALNYIGAIPNMLDPRYNEKLLSYCLKESPSKLLFTFDGCYQKFLKIEGNELPDRIVAIPAVASASLAIKAAFWIKNKPVQIQRKQDCTWKQFIRFPVSAKARENKEYEPDSCAFILHTGGTTGNPKGVMLSNRSVNAVAQQYFATGYGDHKREQTVLDIIPPFASYGLCVSIHMPLCAGVSLIMIPKFDPERFGDLIAYYKPNYIAAVPGFLENMIKSTKINKMDLSFMVLLGCGGDSMTIEQENRINAFMKAHNSEARVYKGYGMSEVSATACTCWKAAVEAGSIGIPFVKTAIKIINPTTYEELPYQVSGEICISGPGMMLGYVGNEELTQKTIRRHKDGLLWVHTGDLGHITEDGFLFHDGRIKRMIVRYDGFKIYPEAVEQVISKHPQVQQCAVVKTKDEKFGMIAKAFIVLKTEVDDKERIWNEIIQYCNQDLAERSVPQAHAFISCMPLTSLGKIDYRALEEKAAKEE